MGFFSRSYKWGQTPPYYFFRTVCNNQRTIVQFDPNPSRGREVVSRKAHNLKAAVRFSSPQQESRRARRARLLCYYLTYRTPKSVKMTSYDDSSRRASGMVSTNAAPWWAMRLRIICTSQAICIEGNLSGVTCLSLSPVVSP